MNMLSAIKRRVMGLDYDFVQFVVSLDLLTDELISLLFDGNRTVLGLVSKINILVSRSF